VTVLENISCHSKVVSGFAFDGISAAIDLRANVLDHNGGRRIDWQDLIFDVTHRDRLQTGAAGKNGVLVP
jgi:hypothetical protein